METPPRDKPRRALSENNADDAVGLRFYDWATPAKPSRPGGRRASPGVEGRGRALSHPALRHQPGPATPLSKVVRAAQLERDAALGPAYAKKRDLLLRLGRCFDVAFDSPGPLGFKICLGRVGDAGGPSTRKRVLVDETFESSPAFDALRPRDELIAINGQLVIEIDAEAFAALVARLRALPRPLVLTFAKGHGRARAFERQTAKRADAAEREAAVAAASEVAARRRAGPARAARAHEDIDAAGVVEAPPSPGALAIPPLDRADDDADLAPSCGVMCFGVSISCDYVDEPRARLL